VTEEKGVADLSAALESGSLSVLLGTAIALGFLHTVLGPDHYVPFVMMAKAQSWSRLKTAVVSVLCGLGHVGSSVVIGLTLAFAGMAFAEWEGSRWAGWHEARGSLAAWLLIGVGTAFFLWGVISASRGRRHAHVHTHEDRATHTHEHSHKGVHMHVHGTQVRNLTPWVLFTIFILGPCESLIPLMLAAWAVAGMGGSLLVAAAFSAVTVLTILGTVSVLMLGISRIPFGRLDRWSTAAAGLSLGLCGVAIRWLGL
jgi:ABC-type nickel/cobalt efflux system permease component RcnA